MDKQLPGGIIGQFVNAHRPVGNLRMLKKHRAADGNDVPASARAAEFAGFTVARSGNCESAGSAKADCAETIAHRNLYQRSLRNLFPLSAELQAERTKCSRRGCKTRGSGTGDGGRSWRSS